jgi:tyrosyl-tRNA synthetase
MGKTAKGAVWLSKEMLSPYEFWQYWRNVDDADVIKLMYLFTDLNVEEIKRMESLEGQELNSVKKILADEVTAITHGRDSLADIHSTAEGMFENTENDFSFVATVPKYYLKKSNSENISIVDIIVESNLCASRGDAKRLLRGNGVYVNDETISDDYKIPHDLPIGATLKLSCGKKKHILVVLEQ